MLCLLLSITLLIVSAEECTKPDFPADEATPTFNTDELVRSLREAGIVVSDKLRLRQQLDGQYAVEAQSDLTPDETLLKVPQDAMMTFEYIFRSYPSWKWIDLAPLGNRDEALVGFNQLQ
jgi:hypothetical protein